MLKIAFSPIYQYDLDPNHRFPMIKYELIPEQLLLEGTVTDDHFFAPDKLSDDQILLTHTQDYLDKLNHQNLTAKEIRKIGFPMRPNLIERGKYISMGTYQCALYALENKIAMNIAGGTHHAFASHGEGFCIFNDFAITANLLLKNQMVNKILIVDLDVHQGNGTAKIFESDPRVFTFSMHGERNYPTKKERSDLDIAIPDKTQDEHYLRILKNTLPNLMNEVEPDMVFYLSGVDVLASDKLGRLSMSMEGCKERDRIVLDLCHKNNIPLIVSMGGGYSEEIKYIIEAHANTFRLAQDIFF